MNAIVNAEPNDIAQQLPEETESLIKASVAENTRKAYQRVLQSLTTWLSGRTLSDALLANYITLYTRTANPRNYRTTHRRGEVAIQTSITGTINHIRRGDNIQPTRLHPHSARRIIKKRAADAGVEGFISGHSLRVGSAVSLAQAGATVVDMQVAERWKSSQMPAHYAKAELAERGAIARFKDGK